MPKGHRGGVLGGLAATTLVGLVGLACAMTPERLPPLERRFYDLMDESSQRDAFLELDDGARELYLHKTELWDQWIALSDQERAAVQRGEVHLGFHEFAVYMAWGRPADTLDRSANNDEVYVHTFIRCTSGPKRGRFVLSTVDCDGTSEERRVTLRNGIVVEKIAD